MDMQPASIKASSSHAVVMLPCNSPTTLRPPPAQLSLVRERGGALTGGRRC